MKLQNKNEIYDSVYAFSGEKEDVTIYCDNIILNDVIDKFGTDIRLAKLDKSRFVLNMSIPPHGVKFWALQYLPYAEVVEPKWLRNEIAESIKGNKYEKGD